MSENRIVPVQHVYLSEMVEDRLRAMGVDGLVHPWTECGCRCEDLMPCGAPHPECEAAYDVGPYDESDHWMVAAHKNGRLRAKAAVIHEWRTREGD